MEGGKSSQVDQDEVKNVVQNVVNDTPAGEFLSSALSESDAGSKSDFDQSGSKHSLQSVGGMASTILYYENNKQVLPEAESQSDGSKEQQQKLLESTKSLLQGSSITAAIASGEGVLSENGGYLQGIFPGQATQVVQGAISQPNTASAKYTQLDTGDAKYAKSKFNLNDISATSNVQ